MIRVNTVLTSILPTLIIVGCNNIDSTDKQNNYGHSSENKVTSYVSVNPEKLNTIIEMKNLGNKVPLQIVTELFNLDKELIELSIHQTISTINSQKNVKFTIIRDGYKDDSVRGEWNEITMSLAPSMKWIVINAKNAFSCWRLEHVIYQKNLCP